MAFIFKGFFIQNIRAGDLNSNELDNVDNKAIVKEFSKPFQGVGIYLFNYKKQKDGSSNESYLRGLAAKFGFEQKTWIFLDYQEFGDRLDSVMGLGYEESGEFGPIYCDDYEKVDDVYTELMNIFHPIMEDGIDYPPFHKKFWGINRY